MNDPQAGESEVEQHETSRIKPGLKGMGLKTALGFLLVGLVPTTLALSLIWPLAQRSSTVTDELANTVCSLRTQAKTQRTRLQELQTSDRELRLELGHTARKLQVQKARRVLQNGLGPLVAGKSIDEVASDDKVTGLIEAGQGPCRDIVLLHAESKKIVAGAKRGEKEELQQGRESLEKALAGGEKLPEADEPGWHSWPLADTGYSVGCLLNPVAPAEKSEFSEIEPAKVDERPILGLAGDLSRRAWVLTIGMPLIALCLGLFFFFSTRKRLLTPLTTMIHGARALLENPGEVGEEVFEGTGLVEDLAASLQRVRERLVRLQSLDEHTQEQKRRIMLLTQVIDRASASNLDIRTEVKADDLEELSLAVNRLLERLAERFEALRQAGSHLTDSARRLAKLAKEISATLEEPDDEHIVDQGTLGDIVGVDLESLSRKALKLAEQLGEGKFEEMAGDERQSLGDAGDAAMTELKSLARRIDQLSESIGKLRELRQETEVLETNMAIASEARSWTSIQKAGENAGRLSRSFSSICDQLDERLGQISTSASGLDDHLKKVSSLASRCIGSLEQWQELSGSLQKQRDDLLENAERVRPAASTLGADLRTLTSRLSRCRDVLSSRREVLGKITNSTVALGKTADEIMQLIKWSEPTAPLPALVTRDLAITQQTLERAMRDLAEAAAEGGIEALSADATAILEHIRETATEARDKVLASADRSAPSSESEPEPGT